MQQPTPGVGAAEAAEATAVGEAAVEMAAVEVEAMDAEAGAAVGVATPEAHRPPSLRKCLTL